MSEPMSLQLMRKMAFAAGRSGVPADPRLVGCRVLVVEDHPVNQRIAG